MRCIARPCLTRLTYRYLALWRIWRGGFCVRGGGEKLAQERKVPFLGRIPLNAEVRKGGDYGRPVSVTMPESEVGQAFRTLAQTVAARISVVMLQTADVIPLNVIG